MIDLGAGLLIRYSRVYVFYDVFSIFSFKYIQNLRTEVHCVETQAD